MSDIKLTGGFPKLQGALVEKTGLQCPRASEHPSIGGREILRVVKTGEMFCQAHGTVVSA